MNNQDLSKLNAIIRNIENKELLTESTQQVNEIGSIAGKLIPGVGLGLSAYDAYKRAKAGDWGGAALSGLGGVASLVPGVGTGITAGLTGAQLARDKARTGSWLPSDDKIAAASNPQKPTQVAQAPQKAWPPSTQPITQQGPDEIEDDDNDDEVDGDESSTQLASIQNKEKPMTETERISELKAKLQQIDEGPLDSIAKGAANLVKGAKFGWQSPQAAINLSKNPNTGIATKLGRTAGVTAGKTANFIGKNKKAIALGAVPGAGAAYAMGKFATPPELKSLTAAERNELEQLVNDTELRSSQDPEIQELLSAYDAIMDPSIGTTIGRGINAPLSAAGGFIGDVAKGVFGG